MCVYVCVYEISQVNRLRVVCPQGKLVRTSFVVPHLLFVIYYITIERMTTARINDSWVLTWKAHSFLFPSRKYNEYK